jgi:hypothetical protein
LAESADCLDLLELLVVATAGADLVVASAVVDSPVVALVDLAAALAAAVDSPVAEVGAVVQIRQ